MNVYKYEELKSILASLKDIDNDNIEVFLDLLSDQNSDLFENEVREIAAFLNDQFQDSSFQKKYTASNKVSRLCAFANSILQKNKKEGIVN
ncbi:MAG: hypothetical protein JEZ08_11890 [Clostridiales bacterium]|nr:hypothetical protein [Clostridiales bacterium]